MSKTLVVDGDIIVYQVVTECTREERTEDDEIQSFLYVPEAMEQIEGRVRTTAQQFNCDAFVMCFGSRTNFRKMINPAYKSNRAGKKKPLGFTACVSECCKHLDGLKLPKLEADDVCGLLATNPSYLGGAEGIVLSEDKDMATLPVPQINPRKLELGEVIVEPHEAMFNWMVQTLSGDQSDGYKGCPGIGPKKASDALKKVGTPDDDDDPDEYAEAMFDDVVVPLFQKADLTADEALLNARMARILRDDDYSFENQIVTLWAPRSMAEAQLSDRRVRSRRRNRRPRAVGTPDVKRRARQRSRGS